MVTSVPILALFLPLLLYLSVLRYSLGTHLRFVGKKLVPKRKKHYILELEKYTYLFSC